MPRAGTLAFLAIPCVCAAITLSSSTVTTGCDTATTFDSPDAAPPPCDQGPFAFPAALQQGDTTTPGCSSDDNANLPVIALLPHGTRYPVGDTVNFVGNRDPEGDCNLQTVCHCQIPDPSQVPTGPPVLDGGGADGGDAAAPAPAPVSGGPAWQCF